MNCVDEYAKALGALTETSFETEACIRLEHAVIGFQRVPAKPHGDGGLDGFSHSGERGYCCYGPQTDSFTKPKDLVTHIVNKFKDDLLRLCELQHDKKNLVHYKNNALPDILPKGKKLTLIVLITNWFESHQVIGPLHTAFNEYKIASECSFVAKDAQIQIIGPVQFSQIYYADELALFSLQNRAIVSKLQNSATLIALEPPPGFDSKMTILKLIRPGKDLTVDLLADQFRRDWKMNLAFEQELDETLPTLHQALQDGRRRILTKVNQRMLNSKEPWSELVAMADDARNIFVADFEAYGALVDDLSNGEIARLIGICPIGWEAN